MERTILKICMEKGFLLDKEMLGIFAGLDEGVAKSVIEGLCSLKTEERVITKSFFAKNSEKLRGLASSGEVAEKFFFSMGYMRKELESGAELDEKQSKEKKLEGNYVKVLSSPVIAPRKISVLDFVKHFRARFNQIKKILEARGLENLSSIRKIGNNRDNFTVIAAVINKRITKNKNILIDIEDLTGKTAVLVNHNKEEVFQQAKDLLQDDIVAFQVTGNSEMLFANNIVYPDAFLQEKKKINEDVWVAFTSDFHTGSKMSLEKNLLKFINWLNGSEGDEKQKEIAKKVKYLFLTGDNIDGVGVYPDQWKLLSILDIKDQYKRLAEILRMVRPDIKMILAPGQHDGVRIAEPQPIIEEDYAPELHKIPNLTLVSNPALIEIIGGIKVLVYHGASMHSVVDEIEDIRMNYKADVPTRIVKELLKRRHLAPTHGSVVYIPHEKEDPLTISQVPDIVATGDLHRPDVSIYNNILMVASSCWQSITPFEEKVGNHPDPCKVPLFNLKTREIKILDFSDAKEDFVNVDGEKMKEAGK